jgi:hypothetical protein
VQLPDFDRTGLCARQLRLLDLQSRLVGRNSKESNFANKYFYDYKNHKACP